MLNAMNIVNYTNVHFLESLSIRWQLNFLFICNFRQAIRLKLLSNAHQKSKPCNKRKLQCCWLCDFTDLWLDLTWGKITWNLTWLEERWLAKLSRLHIIFKWPYAWCDQNRTIFRGSWLDVRNPESAIRNVEIQRQFTAIWWLHHKIKTTTSWDNNRLEIVPQHSKSSPPPLSPNFHRAERMIATLALGVSPLVIPWMLPSWVF